MPRYPSIVRVLLPLLLATCDEIMEYQRQTAAQHYHDKIRERCIVHIAVHTVLGHRAIHEIAQVQTQTNGHQKHPVAQSLQGDLFPIHPSGIHALLDHGHALSVTGRDGDVNNAEDHGKERDRDEGFGGIHGFPFFVLLIHTTQVVECRLQPLIRSLRTRSVRSEPLV